MLCRGASATFSVSIVLSVLGATQVQRTRAGDLQTSLEQAGAPAPAHVPALRASASEPRNLEAVRETCSAVAGCGRCYHIGCVYCEVGAVPWSGGRNPSQDQGDSLDYTCILTTGANGFANGCGDLLTYRSDINHARTIVQDKCDTVDGQTPAPVMATATPTTPSPTPPMLRTAGREEAETESEDNGLPFSMAAVPFFFLPCFVCCSVAIYYWWRRPSFKKEVRVAPIEDGPATVTLKQLAPVDPADRRAWVLSEQIGGAAGLRAPGEAQVWDFGDAGALAVSDIDKACVALKGAEDDDKRYSKSGEPRRRCLAFGVHNHLGDSHLVALNKVLNTFPAASVSLYTDWSRASEASLRILAKMLTRRGRCNFRVSKPGVPEPLELPLRMPPPLLAQIAEAVAVADHGEVSDLNLIPFDLISGRGNSEDAVNLPLNAFRLSATEMVQTSNKLGDLGIALACGFVWPWAARLATIRLIACDIGDDGAIAISRVVGGPAGPMLKELNLSSNNIGDVGMSFLADALPYCDSLERLLLDRNRVGRKGAEALAKMLPRSEIRDLVLGSHLGGNPGIGEHGAIALAGAFNDEMPRAASNRANRLSTLALDACAIGDRGAKAIADALPKSALVSLSLARCRITDEVSMEILQALPACTRALDLAGNFLTDSTGMFVGDLLAARPELAVSIAQNHLTTPLKTLLGEEHRERLRL